MSDLGSHPALSRRLPDQPSLEQLRKQAKELLKEFQSGEPGAIAEVHRFERTREGSSFALNDAQRVIARAYGFASWPKLKAFVDGANIARFSEAVQTGDMTQVRSLLASRPELVSIDRSEGDEHRGLHYAVLGRNAAMVRLLMEAGADARKGIWPHRDATSAFTLARERHFDDIVAIIEEEERHRREEMSCLNATVSPVQDQISAAIAQGDDAAAMQLLDQDRSLIHACDRDGMTPLHVAARRSRVELVAWLLERRANVHKKDPRELTPLDQAALGVDPRNKRGERFPRVAELLLEHRAALTVRAAVALGDLSQIRQFIAAEPTLLRQISASGGLLTLAVNHRQLGSAELLLDLGADVDERVLLEGLEEPTASWGSPLWNAALAADLTMTRLLLDRGADPNANVYASGWPLRNAWGHADDRVKNLLLERGARPQPYMVAETHDVAEAKSLLANAPNEELAQELAWSAADHGCPEIVAMALAHLDWPATDPRWHWILIQPMRGAGDDSTQNEGHFRSLEVLLRHGVDANIARFHETALHFTAAHQSGLSGDDRARFAAMLIDHGARLDMRDDLLKSTPLGWACRWGRTEMVKLLIQRGCPVRERDAEAWATPHAWAQKMGHMEIEAILKQNFEPNSGSI
jgi:ankyrin repeat protein